VPRLRTTTSNSCMGFGFSCSFPSIALGSRWITQPFQLGI
jgi:hypothetical protein